MSSRLNHCELWIAWTLLLTMGGSWLDDDRHTGKGVSALEVTVSQNSVQVARGQAAILPCSFSTSAALTNLNVIWMVIPLSNANQPQQVIIYQGGQVFSLANQLSGRVGFVSTMPHPSSASIVINNTQLSDTGTYQCLVNNLPDRGGRNIGVIGLTVLVPPSVPVCVLQGSLDVGSDVVLMCGSEEGIPTPSYSWEKMDSLPGRLPLNALQDHQQGSVSLRNISVGVSGVYQCTSSNAVGKSTCTLDLQVVAPQPQRVGLIAGTVATSILGLVVLSLLVTVSLFYWRNRNKYEEEEIPNEIREDDLPPKRSSSSVKSSHGFHGGGGGGGGCGDASSSENDTLTSTNTYNSTTRYWHRPSPESHAHNHHAPPPVSSYDDTHAYTRYNGDTTHRTFSHGHNASQRSPTTTLVAPGSAPLTRHSHHHHQQTGGGSAPVSSTANGSHTLPPPPSKTLVVTTNSAPPPCPPAVPARGASSGSNGTVGVAKTPGGGKHHHHHPHHHHTSYAVSQATLERMGAVPVMVPAQSRAGSLV